MRAVISTLLPCPEWRRQPPGEPPVMLAARAECDARDITVDCCLGPERESPFRTAGKEGQAFSVDPALAPAIPKKPAPSLL